MTGMAAVTAGTRAVPTGHGTTGVRAGRGLRRVALWALAAFWPVVAVVSAWAAWVHLAGVPPAVAPDPAHVAEYLSANLTSLLGDAWQTTVVVVCGLMLGTASGIVVAGLSWFSDMLRAIINGPVLLTQCLPVATITPVLARVFGYNQLTIVLIAAIIAFFPVLVFTSAGLRATPPGADDLFAVLGAGRWQRFRRLAVPSAIPRLLVALGVSVVAAVAGAMLAQWVMGTSGLGARLVVAQASFRTAEAWACSVIAIVISVVLYAAVSALGRRATERFD